VRVRVKGCMRRRFKSKFKSKLYPLKSGAKKTKRIEKVTWKSRGSHVVPIPSRFDTENRRNALMGLILILKIPGSREMIV
jgi:hypothetical protein